MSPASPVVEERPDETEPEDAEVPETEDDSRADAADRTLDDIIDAYTR